MAVEKQNPADELPVLRADELARQPDAPTWLVRDLWLHLGVGWCAGQPKSMKTHLAIDVAISVASGTPCLGNFAVEQPGPALVFLAEDALPRVRERIAALCAHRQLDLAALDLYVITTPRLQLDVEADRDRLDATIARIKPRLLVLDPLVRLHACDESSAPEMAALLGFLRALSRHHDLAIVITHHLTKRAHHRQGQGLRGSGDLWAWADSAAYLTRHDDKIEMVLEHRSAAAPEPITLALVSGSVDQTPHLELVGKGGDAKQASPPLGERIRKLLCDATEPLSRTALRCKLRVNNQRLGEAITFLELHGMVERTETGWRLPPKPVPETTTAPAAQPRPADQLSLPLDDNALAKKKRDGWSPSCAAPLSGHT